MRSVLESPLTLNVVGALHRHGMASLREIAKDLHHDSTDRVRVTLARLCMSGLAAVQGNSGGVDLWGLTDEGASKRDELIEALNGKEIGTRSHECRSRQATQV